MGTEPRGIRNNNPGNIRIGSSNWQGKIPVSENTDGAFEQFYEMEYGVRAMVVLINNYILWNPSITLGGIIRKYAPSSENNTDAYIQAVADGMHMGTEQPAKDWFYQVDFLADFITGMIYHENGKNISNSDVIKGIELANVL